MKKLNKIGCIFIYIFVALAFAAHACSVFMFGVDDLDGYGWALLMSGVPFMAFWIMSILFSVKEDTMRKATFFSKIAFLLETSFLIFFVRISLDEIKDTIERLSDNSGLIKATTSSNLSESFQILDSAPAIFKIAIALSAISILIGFVSIILTSIPQCKDRKLSAGEILSLVSVALLYISLTFNIVPCENAPDSVCDFVTAFNIISIVFIAFEIAFILIVLHKVFKPSFSKAIPITFMIYEIVHLLLGVAMVRGLIELAKEDTACLTHYLTKGIAISFLGGIVIGIPAMVLLLVKSSKKSTKETKTPIAIEKQVSVDDSSNARTEPAAQSSQAALADELQKYKKLYEDNLITEAEYEEKRRKLLGL